ncbi:uncharacterized protein LOC133532781 [Cydia pomonella]|uniref:uncharacterized protein LOC133532781 n=1 Tax=Cydia pomonella TaxID=82600 RepID=UPI002ADE0587|nr:uncharacterized protein LOC133532781 [Cydia pomonella]
MARTNTFFLLMIVSSICFSLVTSLKQRHRNPRKTNQNPYHPEDEKLTELLDFSSEDSDYFVDRFGQLSEEETTIIDKKLKINGRHFNLQKHDIVERLKLKRRKHH